MSEIKVNKIKSQQGSDAFTIASDGGVTYETSLAITGGTPAWRIGRATDQNFTTSGSYVKAEWDNTDDADENIFMQNVTYSSGFITVPVAGIYQINATVRIDGLTTDSGYFILSIRRNNINASNADTYLLKQRYTSTYVSFNVSDVFKADANDTFSIHYYSSNDTSWHANNNVSAFSGARIG